MKIAFLFLAIWWTLVNIGRLIKKNDISGLNILLQAIGITGFIYLQFIN